MLSTIMWFMPISKDEKTNIIFNYSDISLVKKWQNIMAQKFIGDYGGIGGSVTDLWRPYLLFFCEQAQVLHQWNLKSYWRMRKTTSGRSTLLCLSWAEFLPWSTLLTCPTLSPMRRWDQRGGFQPLQKFLNSRSKYRLVGQGLNTWLNIRSQYTVNCVFTEQCSNLRTGPVIFFVSVFPKSQHHSDQKYIY